MHKAKITLMKSKYLIAPALVIGGLLGGRDHATIIHGVDKITRELDDNQNTITVIETIKKKIVPN